MFVQLSKIILKKRENKRLAKQITKIYTVVYVICE